MKKMNVKMVGDAAVVTYGTTKVTLRIDGNGELRMLADKVLIIKPKTDNSVVLETE
jgi:hypothetical protein